MYSLQVGYVHQIYFLLKKEKWDLRILQPLKQQSRAAILVYICLNFFFGVWPEWYYVYILRANITQA